MLSLLSDSAFFSGLLGEAAIISLLILAECILWFFSGRIEREYERAKKESVGIFEIETFSLTYYRKRQMIGIIRVLAYLVAIFLSALFYDVQAFGFVALALGALVIVQRDTINSLIAYIWIISNFKIGDDIQVLDDAPISDNLGEIVRITPFQTILSGKDDSGEYNGRRISIPNYKLNSKAIFVQDLKSDTYRRIVLKAIYKPGEYAVEFGEFLTRLRAFLDDFLPKRHLNHVGNFRSFAGMHYKLNFEYDNEGNIVLHIAFISRSPNVSMRKENIILFIESLRTGKARAVPSKDKHPVERL